MIQAEQQTSNPLLEQLAQGIVARKLEVPACIFLEMHLPLTALLHTSTLLFQPLLSPLFGAERLTMLSRILAERKNVERLLQRINEISEYKEAAAANPR